VGDSRAYLFRHGSIERLTRDYTLRQMMVDAGVFAANSKESRAVRNALTSRLGGGVHSVQVDTRHVHVVDGDCLMLCSDGPTDRVRDDEISRILATHTAADTACRALVDLALERGGQDNVTVVIARYSVPHLTEPRV